jgi:hypothetical protein
VRRRVSSAAPRDDVKADTCASHAVTARPVAARSRRGRAGNQPIYAKRALALACARGRPVLRAKKGTRKRKEGGTHRRDGRAAMAHGGTCMRALPLLLQALIVSWSWIRSVDYHDAGRGGWGACQSSGDTHARTHGARGGNKRYAQALLGNLSGRGGAPGSALLGNLCGRGGAPGSPENPWTYARGTARPWRARRVQLARARPRAAGDRPTGVRPWRQGHSATRRFLVQPATSRARARARARDKNKGASQ